MHIYYSCLCQIGNDLSESLDQMIASGADNIELMLDGDCWNEFENHSGELLRQISRKGIDYSVHSPVWDMNLTSENAQARQAALDAYKHSIVFASLIGAKHVVLHPGFCYASVFDKLVARQRAEQAIASLCEFNKKYGMLLLVENVGSKATSIFTQNEYIDFIESFEGKIGSLLDIGHAHLCCWDLPQLISRLKKQIFAVHLHDNDGNSDSHLPLERGNVDWESIFKSLLECDSTLKLILEYDIGTPLAELRRGKEILTEIFQPNALTS